MKTVNNVLLALLIVYTVVIAIVCVEMAVVWRKMKGGMG